MSTRHLLSALSILAMLPIAFWIPGASASVVPTASSVNNAAPSFSAGPSDGSSSATTPTNVGSNVTFTATATDTNGEQYYLAICKTNAITPGNNAAPTCASVPNTWAITPTGSPVNSGSQATLTYAAVIGDAQVNAWYAFVCDKAPSGACSAVSQGTGDTGSPFEVNHRPVIGTITAGSSYGSNSSVDPGNTTYFQVGVTDADSTGTADTITLYICATASFTPGVGCASGICSSTATASGGNAQCNSASLVPTPTSHGAKNYYLYLTDSHTFADGGTGGSNTYSVTDVAPALNTFSVSNITLVAGSSTAKTYTVNVTDNNGDNDIVSATGVLYDDDALNLSSGTCTTNENNCYPDVSCSLTNVGAGTDVTALATCNFTVWFNANYNTAAGQGWRFHVNPADGTNSPTGLSDSAAISTNALLGFSTGTPTIAYGTLALGADSSGQSATLQNVGNQVLDIEIYGSDMTCTTASTCSTTTIARAQQKFHETTSTFDWASGGGYALLSSASAGDETAGCLNRDLAIRTAHASTALDETIYWKLRAPSSGQLSGTYQGSISVTAAASNTCTGTLY